MTDNLKNQNGGDMAPTDNHCYEKPGLSFSWKRALGVTAMKQKVARATGIPTTRGGLERKLGGLVLGALLGKKRKRKRR